MTHSQSCTNISKKSQRGKLIKCTKQRKLDEL